ncbi:hypothetical protein ACLB2K_041504 [Fragaria x ananassa]
MRNQNEIEINNVCKENLHQERSQSRRRRRNKSYQSKAWIWVLLSLDSDWVFSASLTTRLIWLQTFI